MARQGDFRPGGSGWPADAPAPTDPTEVSPGPSSARSSAAATRRSSATALLIAVGVVLVSGLAWAVLRAILELGVGLLVVSAVGGWGIGAALRPLRHSRLAAGGLAVCAWLSGLALTWFLTRLTLPASSLDLLERLRTHAFLDFTAQQFGLLEVLSLVAFTGAALIAVSRSKAGFVAEP